MTIFLYSLLNLSGCAGYHFNTNSNPLIGYDIKSIAVPMFINRSVFPDLSTSMTKEIILTLNDYSGLRVISGDDKNADAVLIGIINSADHLDEAVKNKESLFTNDKENLKASLGNRNGFYYPVSTSFDFSFDFYIIKNPTREELELLSSELGRKMGISPRVVLRDTINASGNFTRVTNDSLSNTSGGDVNFVKNKGIFEKSLKEACAQAAQNFRQVVLNAF